VAGVRAIALLCKRAVEKNSTYLGGFAAKLTPEKTCTRYLNFAFFPQKIWSIWSLLAA
jgi:hypothetical protein